MKRALYSFVCNKTRNIVGQIRSVTIFGSGKCLYFVEVSRNEYKSIDEKAIERADKGMGRSTKTRGRDRYEIEMRHLNEEMENGASSRPKGKKARVNS